jgi:hypothetical protein
VAIRPQFITTPRCDRQVVSAANTNRDGTGTIVDIFAAGTNGSKVTSVVTKATGTTTAGMVRLFIKESSTYRLFDEVPVSAATPSATVETFRDIQPFDDLILESGQTLAASTHLAETFVVHVLGGDF